MRPPTSAFCPSLQPGVRSSWKKSERAFQSGETGGEPSSSTPILGTLPDDGAASVSDDQRTLSTKVMRSPRVRRVIKVSCGHGRVGTFYALSAGEGNQILQNKPS